MRRGSEACARSIDTGSGCVPAVAGLATVPPSPFDPSALELEPSSVASSYRSAVRN
jgi:hypothetical protein